MWKISHISFFPIIMRIIIDRYYRLIFLFHICDIFLDAEIFMKTKMHLQKRSFSLNLLCANRGKNNNKKLGMPKHR